MEARLALAAAALTDVAIAGAYAYAGLRVLGRRYVQATLPGGRMFAMWWLGVATTGALSFTINALVLAGWDDLAALAALDASSLVAISAAIVGFVGYLGFLFWGSGRPFVVCAVLYTLLAAYNGAQGILTPATGYHVDAWRPILERPETGSIASTTITTVLLSVPLVAGIAAYPFVLRFLQGEDQRRRVKLTTMGLALWLVGVILVAIPGLGSSDGAQVSGRALILGSTWAIWRAYAKAGPLERTASIGRNT